MKVRVFTKNERRGRGKGCVIAGEERGLLCGSKKDEKQMGMCSNRGKEER